MWQLETGEGPIVATAIHHGHELRGEVSELTALAEDERLREEDPYTGEWTRVAPTRLIVTRSRFEMDLNRPRERAVYRRPEEAWGLELWKREPSNDLIERSLAQYDAFYRELGGLLRELEARHGRFVLLDLHSYNHRRGGPAAEPDDPAGNPQVNVGTGTLNREAWAPLVERFLADLAAFDFPGGRLDVRENVRFRGGQLSRWVHESFPRTGCTLAIEVKKFFMDEWTGEPDQGLMKALEAAFLSTLPGLLEKLGHS